MVAGRRPKSDRRAQPIPEYQPHCKCRTDVLIARTARHHAQGETSKCSCDQGTAQNTTPMAPSSDIFWIAERGNVKDVSIPHAK
jgi:hypothetical protein